MRRARPRRHRHRAVPPSRPTPGWPASATAARTSRSSCSTPTGPTSTGSWPTSEGVSVTPTTRATASTSRSTAWRTTRVRRGVGRRCQRRLTDAGRRPLPRRRLPRHVGASVVARRSVLGGDRRSGPFDPATETLDSFAVGVIDIAANTTTIVVSQPGLDGQLHFPRWSPDGRHLVFWNETDTPSVWIVDSDGTGLHQLSPPDLLAGDPDWSPDGARIVVSTRPLLHFDDGPSDLYTITPDGSDFTRLTDSETSGVRYTQPGWTPDGTAIVYTASLTADARSGRARGRIARISARWHATVPDTSRRSAGGLTHPAGRGVSERRAGNPRA